MNKERQKERKIHWALDASVIIMLGYALLFSAGVQALETKAKVGGTFVNVDESIVFTGSLDSKWDYDQYQGVFEADYAYKAEDGDQTINKFKTSGKLIKSLTEKHYIVTTGSYDYDEFRDNQDRIVMGAGHGYKILRTDRHKASIENSVAYLLSNDNNQPIIRSSFWYAYNVNKRIAFTNKMLWESGDDDYLRNETAFDYSLTDKVTVGLKNVYTKDPIEYSIFNITLGVKF
jgi:putative salt-induced outer membrane protein YdiY